MKKTQRFFTLASAALLTATAVVAFSACETNKPEVAITYEFNGSEYKVEYVLSRKGAPQTVRHFMELADAEFYNDTIIHDYQGDGTFLYGGGYKWNAEAGDVEDKLVEINYYDWVQSKDATANFTKTVFQSSENGVGKTPIYSVYGEFTENGCTANSQKVTHNATLYRGALAMYYTDKGADTTRVSVTRSDDGSVQDGNYYKYNSATSMFYTWTGTDSRSDLDKKYSVFGYAKDFSQMQALLDAIADYEEEVLTGDEESFTESVVIDNVNANDPFEVIRNSKISATYEVPVSPIIIKSVKVTKY